MDKDQMFRMVVCFVALVMVAFALTIIAVIAEKQNQERKKKQQQAFCGSRGDTKCKDRYWNTVDPNKRNNTTRTSPASKRWREEQADKRDQYSEYHPMEWDHGDFKN